MQLVAAVRVQRKRTRTGNCWPATNREPGEPGAVVAVPTQVMGAVERVAAVKMTEKMTARSHFMGETVRTSQNRS